MDLKQMSGPSRPTRRTPREAELDQVVALGKALSDATRVRVLVELADGERCVGDLVLRLGLRQSNISHHLGRLRSLGIVAQRRSGKQVLYQVAAAAAGETERPTLRLPRHGVEVAIGRSPGRP